MDKDAKKALELDIASIGIWEAFVKPALAKLKDMFTGVSKGAAEDIGKKIAEAAKERHEKIRNYRGVIADVIREMCQSDNKPEEKSAGETIGEWLEKMNKCAGDYYKPGDEDRAMDALSEYCISIEEPRMDADNKPVRNKNGEIETTFTNESRGKLKNMFIWLASLDEESRNGRLEMLINDGWLQWPRRAWHEIKDAWEKDNHRAHKYIQGLKRNFLKFFIWFWVSLGLAVLGGLWGGNGRWLGLIAIPLYVYLAIKFFVWFSPIGVGVEALSGKSPLRRYAYTIGGGMLVGGLFMILLSLFLPLGKYPAMIPVFVATGLVMGGAIITGRPIISLISIVIFVVCAVSFIRPISFKAGVEGWFERDKAEASAIKAVVSGERSLFRKSSGSLGLDNAPNVKTTSVVRASQRNLIGTEFVVKANPNGERDKDTNSPFVTKTGNDYQFAASGPVSVLSKEPDGSENQRRLTAGRFGLKVPPGYPTGNFRFRAEKDTSVRVVDVIEN